MGDEKQHTVQVKGTAYKFRPIPPDKLSMLVFVTNMNASSTKILSAVTNVLSESAGAEQWDAITDRLISGELEIQDITVKLLKTLTERQAKDKSKTPAAADDAQ